MISQMVPYLPCHDGFRIIPAHLLRMLGDTDEIHLLAFSAGEDTTQRGWASEYCRSVEFVPAATRSLVSQALTRRMPYDSDVIAAVRARIDAVAPDVLHLEGPSLAPLLPLTGARTPALLSAHDALSLRYAHFARFAPSSRLRLANRAYSILARRFERRWFPRVGHVVVTSEPDATALAHCVHPSRIAVIPNGVDLDYLQFREERQAGRLVFTGNMSWPPNVDAARYFATEIFPAIRARVPTAEFWIVGADPSPDVRVLSGLPGVHVTGTVRDLRPWVWSAAVYVSPLRFGAGVKNKILEAMALGAPIVATPSSITGTPLVHNRHLLVTEDGPGMANTVLGVLQSEALGRALAKEARREVELNYTWKSVAHRMRGLWARLCHGRSHEVFREAQA